MDFIILPLYQDRKLLLLYTYYTTLNKLNKQHKALLIYQTS